LIIFWWQQKRGWGVVTDTKNCFGKKWPKVVGCFWVEIIRFWWVLHGCIFLPRYNHWVWVMYISFIQIYFLKTNIPKWNTYLKYTHQKKNILLIPLGICKYTHTIRVFKKKEEKISLYLKTVLMISNCEHFLFLINKLKVHTRFLSPTLGYMMGIKNGIFRKCCIY
jgi:hypothetical protein